MALSKAVGALEKQHPEAFHITITHISNTGISNTAASQTGFDIFVKVQKKPEKSLTGESPSWEQEILNLKDPALGLEDDCSWYLNSILKADHYYQEERRTRVEQNMTMYGHHLFDQLNLNKWRDYWKDRAIEISIYELKYHKDNSRNSIHSIRWEHLEETRLWRGADDLNTDLHITVTRHTGKITKTAPTVDLHFTSRLRQGRRSIHRPAVKRVLLFIARKLDMSVQDRKKDPRPHVAQSVFMRMLKQKKDVLLEVVRPGTFSALEEHLNRKDPGYFDLVHFDCHGIADQEVIEDPKAYLQFLQDGNNKFGLEPIGGDKLAPLLRRKGIKFVVLTACQTAVARMGLHANLARFLALEDIPQTLAMSYWISDDAVEKICTTFYLMLIGNDRNFSYAASQMRSMLYRERGRRSQKNSVPRDVYDWVVPVTYSNDDPGLPRPEVSGMGNFLAPSNPIQSRSSSSLSSTLSHSSHDTRPPELEGNKFMNITHSTLRLEKLLIGTKRVFLYGPGDPEYLKKRKALFWYLRSLWQVTNFLKIVIIVDGYDLDSIESAMSQLQRPSNLGARSRKGHQGAIYQRVEAAIIVDNADVLLDPTLEDSPPSLNNQIQLARAELGKFLDQFGRQFPNGTAAPFAPYLIIAGKGLDRLQPYFMTHYPWFGGNPYELMTDYDTTEYEVKEI